MAESPVVGGRRVERFGGLPLYAVLLLQGLPLDRRLTAMRSSIPQDTQQQLIDRVTTVGAAQSLLPALTWGALYLTALILLLQKSTATQLSQLMRGQWPLLALIALSIGSLAWSPNLGKVIASSFHAVGITLVAMAAAVRCAVNPTSFLKVASLCLATNLLMHLASIAIVPNIGIAYDGRWMGMAAHSNTLGGYALLAVWASLTASLLHGGKGRLLMWACLLISLVVLYGSGSTTSILCGFVVFGFVALLRFSRGWSAELKMLANVIYASLSLGMVVVITAYGGVIGELTSHLGKSSTFTGRDQIWMTAWDLILQHPFFGWGFDDNARVIVETGFIHSGYHNGYLDLAVRGGALALLLVVAAMWLWLRAMRKIDGEWALVCVPMMGGFFMHNLMEVSLFSPRSSIWGVVAMLLFATVLVRRRYRWSSGMTSPVAGARHHAAS